MTSRLFEGNLALDIRECGETRFSVVPGGLSQTSFSDSLAAKCPNSAVREVVPTRSPAKSRFVAVTSIFAVACIVVALSTAVISSIDRSVALGSVSYERIEVKPGDSIWAISEAHSVDGLSTQDVQDLIAEQNGLKKLSVEPGQVLLVPSSR